ncbi:gamma-glutamylcyclotransferase family protein [Herbiconiux sp. P15]|uniref:gamma-glutamylcyclotransferase family protein n=1 Tax=Herbiconiux liukaitaii TaxID=3342799 RepID=UPI0035BB1EF1
MSDRGAVLLFSYGTLQLPEVQRATFGRLLAGRRTAVVGYRLDWLTITDPHVIATSGTDRHPLLVPASDTATAPAPAPNAEVDAEAELDARSEVEGTVFEITADELAAADAYEVDDYHRVLVPLATGEQAWVYVYAGDAL